MNSKLSFRNKAKAIDAMGHFNNGDKVFSIPSYQRKYKWTIDKNLEGFFNIVANLTNNTLNNCFFGTLTIKHSQSKSEILLIDGQQRTTTLYLFVKALHDYNNIFIKDEKIKKQLDGILFTGLSSSFSGDIRIKFTGLEGESALDKLIQGKPRSIDDIEKNIDRKSTLYEVNHNYFVKKIHQQVKDLDGGEVITKIQKMINSLNKIWFARCELNDNDDELAIFENINSKGTTLTIVELLKNFMFMKLNEIYDKDAVSNSEFKREKTKIKKLFEDDFFDLTQIKSSKKSKKDIDILITELIRTYLISKKAYLNKEDNDGILPVKGDAQQLYFDFKSITKHLFDDLKNIDHFHAFLKDINIFVTVNKKIKSFYMKNSKKEYEIILSLMNSVFTNSLFFPVIMHSTTKSLTNWEFNSDGTKIISPIPKEFENVVRVLEAFIIRLRASGVGTRALTQTITWKTYTSLDEFYEYFINGEQSTPANVFLNSLKTIGLKGDSTNLEWLKAMLWRIEQYKNHETNEGIQLSKQDNYFIDWVMPLSTLKKDENNKWSKWISYSSEVNPKLQDKRENDVKAECERVIRTVGNLTLVDQKGKWTDSLFPNKVTKYKEMKTLISKEISKNSEWTIQNIENRSDDLADISKKIWIDRIEEIKNTHS